MKDLQEKRTTYADMIDFCCNNLILNNYIEPELSAKGFYFDDYCGSRYDEESDEYVDIYQQYIITSQDAERLAEYTNEINLHVVNFTKIQETIEGKHQLIFRCDFRLHN